MVTVLHATEKRPHEMMKINKILVTQGRLKLLHKNSPNCVLYSHLKVKILPTKHCNSFIAILS